MSNIVKADGLTIYTQSSLNITNCIQKLETTPKEIRPKNRLILNDRMLEGGLFNLSFENSYISGNAYISNFTQDVEKTNNSSSDYSTNVLTKIFGLKKSLADNTIEYEGKKYTKNWSVQLGKYYDSCIYLIYCDASPEKYTEHLVQDFKTKILSERNEAISSRLLDELFFPIIPPLIQAHLEISKF